jgi:hypothetical protein
MNDALLAELRATAPPAPERLRMRVEAIATRQPQQQASWREWVRPRRALVIALPTALAAMLAVAIGFGLSSSPKQEAQSVRSTGLAIIQGSSPSRAPAPLPASPNSTYRQALAPNVLHAADKAAAVPQPARGRAQNYSATMTVRLPSVGRMSDAMKAAINATRGWGGYVVSAEYNVPGRNGDAQLVVRIPVQHVQAAVQRFSNLGTLAAQQVSIKDVQGTLDTYTRQLLSIHAMIAKLRIQLATAPAGSVQQATLEAQIARLQRQAADVRAEQTALQRKASFATVALTLTTRAAAAAAPPKQGRVERTLRDAAGILALELAFGLYALIVAAPIALIALLAFLAARFARRRADDRLLGST